ncbi:uncharacterized protein LOC110245566 isoform X2 [Exaiptasia diaphana]|nr:uncharacterized protein LOC110245566 isoform X2 [Exaiptasia diaphana]
MQIDDVIREYFNAGYEYSNIVSLLLAYHGIRISISTLKRFLRKKKMRRRNVEISDVAIRRAIQTELNGPGSLLGYRGMWNKLRQDYGVNVARDKVMKILKEMDPTGTEMRKSNCLKRRVYRNKGPNYAWHVDGYDKLRPYGFDIHGCIDGYSRRIMWLEVGPTNKNPAVICGYYLKCVQHIGGCPQILRTDPGSENTLIAALQCTFRRNSTDQFAGDASHRYGKSVFNQRIEAWWSVLKKNYSGWWIETLKDLVEFGALDIGNDFHINCLRFCLMDIIQDELNRFVNCWNNHTIRPSKRAECPHGKPNILYLLPHENGTHDFKTVVSQDDIVWANSICKDNISKTEERSDIFFENVLQREGKHLPCNWNEAIELYLFLVG